MSAIKLLEEARRYVEQVSNIGMPSVEDYHGASRLLASIDALLATGGWKPIETAPKDGNTVLVGRDMGEPWHFVYGAGFYFSKHGIEGWICRGLREPPGELGLGAPTHWMPLPLSPLPGAKL